MIFWLTCLQDLPGRIEVREGESPEEALNRADAGTFEFDPTDPEVRLVSLTRAPFKHPRNRFELLEKTVGREVIEHQMQACGSRPVNVSRLVTAVTYLEPDEPDDTPPGGSLHMRMVLQCARGPDDAPAVVR